MAVGYFALGEAGKDWYEDTAAKLQVWYGEDWRVMAGILAATSVNASVKANVTLALKAYDQYSQGMKPEGFIPAAISCLEEVFTGGEPSGPKVNAFYHALIGDSDAVVVDRWMLRAYGERSLTAAAIRRVTERIRSEAAQVGATPRQYQAAVWCGVKLLAEGERADTRSFVELLGDRLAQTELPL